VQHLQNQIVETSDTPAAKGPGQLHGISEILQAGVEPAFAAGRLTHMRTKDHGVCVPHGNCEGF